MLFNIYRQFGRCWRRRKSLKFVSDRIYYTRHNNPPEILYSVLNKQLQFHARLSSMLLMGKVNWPWKATSKGRNLKTFKRHKFYEFCTINMIFCPSHSCTLLNSSRFPPPPPFLRESFKSALPFLVSSTAMMHFLIWPEGKSDGSKLINLLIINLSREWL